MSSRAQRLAETIERVQRARAASDLAWLRRGRVDLDWVQSARGLLSDEGKDESSQALRERTWTRDEQQAFVRQRAELAFQVELAPGRSLVSDLAAEPFALPFGTEALLPLIRGLWSDGSLEGRTQRANSLSDASRGLARRLLELRRRALHALETQQHALPLPAVATEADIVAQWMSGLPPTAAVPAAASTARSPVDQARAFLDDTADATREMTRWLARPDAPSGAIAWHFLLRGLRAPELDGLARPTRRLARVAQGLHALGFERDLNSRVRAEPAEALFEPRPRVLALALPSDIRVVQATLDFGLLSDLYACHGLGHALALSLVSPALPGLLRRPTQPGLAESFGCLFMQLRADPEYVRRVDGMEPLQVERLTRHAGVIVLLETRLQAALLVAASESARSDDERIQQLTAALGAALGVELPAGVGVLAAWCATPGPGAFEACAAGLAAHVGLRERFDADWFRNPRVSEVLRGAAARGATLSLPAFLEELGVATELSVPRSIELLR